MLDACVYNVGSNYRFVIVLSIFDTYMHHKLDVTILQQKGIQLHNYFQFRYFHQSYCSEFS